MKSTSSGRRDGGIYKQSTHSSEADQVERWGHEGFDQIQRENLEGESANGREPNGYQKQSSDFNNSFRDDAQSINMMTGSQQNQNSQNYQGQNQYKKQNNYKKNNQYGYQYDNDQGRNNHNYYQSESSNQIGNNGGGGRGKKNHHSNSQYFPNDNYKKNNNKNWPNRQSNNNGGQNNYQGQQQYRNNNNGNYQNQYKNDGNQQQHTLPTQQNMRNLKQQTSTTSYNETGQRKKGGQQHNGVPYKKDKQGGFHQSASQVLEDSTMIGPDQDLLPQKTQESFLKLEEDDKQDYSDQNSAHHRQISYSKEDGKEVSNYNSIYSLTVKFNDQKILIEIAENDSVQEVVQQNGNHYKLPKEMQDALIIYINRKVDAIKQQRSLLLPQFIDLKALLPPNVQAQMVPNQILEEQKVKPYGFGNFLQQQTAMAPHQNYPNYLTADHHPMNPMNSIIQDINVFPNAQCKIQQNFINNAQNLNVFQQQPIHLFPQAPQYGQQIPMMMQPLENLLNAFTPQYAGAQAFTQINIGQQLTPGK